MRILSSRNTSRTELLWLAYSLVSPQRRGHDSQQMLITESAAMKTCQDRWFHNYSHEAPFRHHSRYHCLSADSELPVEARHLYWVPSQPSPWWLRELGARLWLLATTRHQCRIPRQLQRRVWRDRGVLRELQKLGRSWNWLLTLNDASAAAWCDDIIKMISLSLA